MAVDFDQFVVVAGMRTGSNFLQETLNEIPGITCHGELFNPHFVGKKNASEMFGVTLAAREADPFSLLSAMKSNSDGMPGFRLFDGHDPRVIDDLLGDRRCAKIILTRNPLESYVSLKIARETDQWKLMNEKRRKTAMIDFDLAEFETYLDETQAFQLRIQGALQRSGQTGFYLSYDDLGDVGVMNGLARFLGMKAVLKSVSKTLKRQNPEPLQQKVRNYDEMRQALATLDRFNLSRTPNFEPRRGPVVPGYVAAARTGALYMPIKGGPVPQVKAWLAALDGVGGDDLRRGFTQKSLRQWKRQHPGHRSFTVVSHPVWRIHTTFCRYILGTGPDAYSDLRDMLRRAHKLDIPKDGPNDRYGPAEHRAAFLSFLAFLKLNLNGQTSVRVASSWASQTNLLQGMADFTLPDMVLRQENLQADLAILAGQIGHDPIPLPDEGAEGPVTLEAIYDAEIEAAVRDLYQRDYMNFGYRAWR